MKKGKNKEKIFRGSSMHRLNCPIIQLFTYLNSTNITSQNKESYDTSRLILL